MAALSSADTTYMADMAERHKATMETARGYLATSPKDRNANLSDMAGMVMKDAKMDMAKMAGMAKPMMGGK